MWSNSIFKENDKWLWNGETSRDNGNGVKSEEIIKRNGNKKNHTFAL